MTSDEERLKKLELIVDQGAPFPVDEFAQLSIGSQVSLESRMRAELEDLAGELGSEGLDVAIRHLEGLLKELISGGAPAELIVEQRETVERLKQRRANYN